MKATVCRPDELSTTDIDTWHAWQRADPRLANPFLTPGFVLAYGARRPDVRVAVVEDGGGVVSYFPFERHGRGVARALGYQVVDTQGLVGRPDAEVDGRELLAACGIAVYEYDHLLVHQARELSRTPQLRPSPVIILKEGWDAWIEEKRRSGSRVRRGLEKRRRMARELGELQFTYDSRDHADLDVLMRWKGAQSVRTGRVDRFQEPWFPALLHDLLDAPDTDAFSIRLSRLTAGDRTVALYLCVRGSGLLGSWMPTFDHAVGAHSPGLISMLALVEAAAADGITKIDLGKGHEVYKQSLKNDDDLIAQGVADRPVPAALWWRLHQAPRRAATAVVGRSPRAYRLADATMRKLAPVRGALQRLS